MSATADEIIEQIRHVVQEDVADRGLRRDPADNLITRTHGDLVAACKSIAETQRAHVLVVTGFYIPHGKPPAGETDGPLGAMWLARAFTELGITVTLAADDWAHNAMKVVLPSQGTKPVADMRRLIRPIEVSTVAMPDLQGLVERSMSMAFMYIGSKPRITHVIALERPGPNYTPEHLHAQPGMTAEHLAAFNSSVSMFDHDRCFTMGGRDVTGFLAPAHLLFDKAEHGWRKLTTIGIGDGGNEIGMGKIPWDVIRRNIPRGELIACRVPTDHLIVAGVSNWGAYALGAGVRLLRGAKFDPELFDTDRERAILERMVEDGPLVDGVTGRQTATVDGLDFDRYAGPLRRIGELLRESS